MKFSRVILFLLAACLPPGVAHAGQLEDAIRGSDHEAVVTSLAEGESPDLKTASGTPLVVLAASLGHIDIVDALLNAGAAVDALASGQATALMYSARSNKGALATRLLEGGADVNLRDTQGDPAVNWGSYYDSLDFIRPLLAAKADTSLRGHGNAFEIALRRGHEETTLALAAYAGKLSSHPAEGRDSIGRPLLHSLARGGDTANLKAALEAGVDPDIEDEIAYTALMHGARDGQIESVKVLLASGADPRHKGHAYGLELTPLHLAAIGDHGAIVALLIARNVDMNAQGVAGQTPLCWALFEGSRQAAVALLRAGADWKIVPDDNTDLKALATAQGWPDIAALMSD